VEVSGSGPLTVAGTLSLSGVGQFTLGRSLTVNGPNNTWSGDSIQTQNGAVFTVGSAATLTGSKTFGMFGAFAVNGTYIVDSPVNSTAPFTGSFSNAGNIDIHRNATPFMASSGLTNTGRVRVAVGQPARRPARAPLGEGFIEGHRSLRSVAVGRPSARFG
jgi:hypothetical protein